MKTLTINGKLVSAREGETILDAAPGRPASGSRPSATFMAWPMSPPAGFVSSRSAIHRLQPACVTKVVEDMVVQTDTERLRHYRRIDRRTPLRRTQPRLLGLRRQR